MSAEFQRRLNGYSDVTYTLEGADALGTPTIWFELSSVTTTVTPLSDDSEEVVYNDLQSATELTDGEFSGVVRLRVEVDVDESGTITGDEVFYTKLFGWQCVDYNDYECASFSSPFSEKPVFSGTFGSGVLSLATDASGNVTLDVSDSASGADLGSVVGSNGEYYLQITSGLFEGHRFDILGGGVDAITLMNDDDVFDETVATFNTLDGVPTDGALNGSSYEVIRYRTVDDLFDTATTFAGEEDSDPSDATRLLFFNIRRTNPGFDTLMVINTAIPRWIRVDDPFAQVDQGGRRLDPGAGLWIHPKSSGDPNAPAELPPVEQIAFGMIADHDQAVPLNEGFNFTAAMWPIDQSPAGPNGRDLTLAAGFDGGTAPSRSTELLFWRGDFVVDDESVTEYQTGYEGLMLADAGPFNFWLDRNDPELTNRDADILLESHRAVMVKLLTGDDKRPHIYPLPNFGFALEVD